ncbi:GTP-binding protein YchF [Puccinia graminis f. sp. tritici CRL 75-36-700-3]|uniref:Obg-like ATPase 1 n=1 Tax=Puccinia graminis f. sp. tritici (strain CRL 75-36-700-3 / race SCCL) TaxID=418459 RepID=E3KP72_PUCGT|nr:GTP-binding protein YchF [Puccinia graminis f. sp. tritici CRL 75-36-700-3]EFP86097.2 GTP-binding protein YchF [Puccinia graminis f. sp. tritici CRL 75-36-700-3]
MPPSLLLLFPSQLLPRVTVQPIRPSLSLTTNPSHTFQSLFSTSSAQSISPTSHLSIKKRMPPKKTVVEKKALLGRPSNNLKIGIVGMPNVGKSSLFNVIAKCDLGKSANFPYATIDPEEARVPVPDERFDWLCSVYKPTNKIPAFLTCIDIAGLTAGASTGAGLGNAFLSHVRAVDGIFQVVRAFDDAEVIHVEGDVDPIRDMEIIHTELKLKDIEWVEKHYETIKKSFRGTGTANLADKAKKEEIDITGKVLAWLKDEGRDVRKGDWNNKEIDVINTLQLLTAKPVTYLINLSETDYIRKKNKWLPKIKAWIDANNPGDLLIPFSVALEERLLQLGVDDEVPARKEELAKIGTTSALGKITTAGYASLHLIRYFTTGPTEVRAWTIRKGTKAPQAAGVIHSDFENKFVCGEIMTYGDLKEHGSEVAVKAAGKYRQQGKPYEMQDGDIAFWKHG